ncbi:MAG TPA: S9 family peptidase [Woeseiaceae bacterium]|nr:S9 family peptidase [Woeseiaceae bacterium]
MREFRICDAKSRAPSRLCILLAVCTMPYAANAQVSKILDPRIFSELRVPSDLQYSIARNEIAFVVSESANLSGGTQSIWTLDRTSGSSRRLSTTGKINAQPRWCADTKCLSFISDRDGKTEIFRLSMIGGEAEKMFASATDILAYEWSPGKNLLAYIADASVENVDPAVAGDGIRESEVSENLTIVNGKYQQLSVFDVTTGKARQLSEGDWRMSSIRWAPNGESIVLSASRDLYSELDHDRLFLFDIADGEFHELWRPDREISNVEVSPNGEFVSAIAARESGPEPFDLVVVRMRDSQLLNLTESTIDRKIQSYKWRDNRSVIAVVAEGFESLLYDIDLDGFIKRRIDPPVSPGTDIVVGENFLGLVGGTYNMPHEIWISDSDSPYRQATKINTDLADEVVWPVPKIIQYESFDGLNIEAALYLPSKGDNSTPFPLIVHVHGGPSARWANGFRPSWAALLVSRGYAVLEPNIRGSTGRDYDFLVMNRNDLGGGDFKDVIFGVDHLVAEGIADPHRLGIGGWSYGGYMAAWAVTQTDRFKVAVSGAPVTNWVSEYGTESPSVNRYDRALLGNLYDNVSYFTNVSPVTHVRNITTPTQLICAENDDIDPIGQCWEFYRGLKQYNVESEFIIYSGVGHSRSMWSATQQTDSMLRMLSWFQRYLSSRETGYAN